jgi:choline monooxygenase
VTVTDTLSARSYVDPAVYEAELEDVFGRSWLLAGSAARLRAPGDQLAVDLGRVRVVLARGEDGVLRAFHNVCRHRAGVLLWDDESCTARSLRCRYHGWRYDLRGRLAQATSFGEELDGDAWALRSVPCAEWRGLVFVHPGPDPEPLERQIGPLGEASPDVRFDSLEPVGTATHSIACNWKVYVENYLEGYHVPFLHLELARDVQLDTYEVRPGDGYALHHAAPRDADAVNDGFWAWVWPNAALNVYRHGTSLERILPAAPDRTVLHYTYLASPSATAEQQRAMLDMSGTLTAEDARICEAVQRNLRTGMYTAGRLSPVHETAVASFQRRVVKHASRRPLRVTSSWGNV